MTGVPPGSQRLLFKAPGRPDQWIEGEDRLIGEWGLVRGCEIEVCSFQRGLVMVRGELMYDRSMIHAQSQQDPILRICHPLRNMNYQLRNTNH